MTLSATIAATPWTNCPPLPRGMPHTLLRAMATLDTIQLEIKPRSRQLLRILLRYVSARNASIPIFPKKNTLARIMGCGEATIFRLLHELENHRLVTRIQQEFSKKNGRAMSGRIQITRMLADMLNLPYDAAVNHMDKLSTVDTVKHDPIHSSPGVDKLSTQSNTRINPGFSTWQQWRLPNDVLWLVQTGGMTAPQVLQLMAIMKRRGQRLSDILACRGERLRQLRGAALYAYLRALTASDTDFAGVVERQLQERRRKTEAEARRTALEAARRRMQGNIYRHARTGLFYRPRGHLVEVYRNLKDLRPLWHAPCDPAFVEAVTLGKMIAVASDALGGSPGEMTVETDFRPDPGLFGMLRDSIKPLRLRPTVDHK